MKVMHGKKLNLKLGRIFINSSRKFINRDRNSDYYESDRKIKKVVGSTTNSSMYTTTRVI